MALPDLESSLGRMLTRIAEKGGGNVELELNGSQQRFQITRVNGGGVPAERFLLWHHFSLGNEYILAYQLFDRSL